MIQRLLIGGAIATVLIAAAPRAAGAGEPLICYNCVFPDTIEVLGVNSAGQPDPAAVFEVLVRDVANNPIAGAPVEVHFGNCVDLRISNQSSGLVNAALADQVLDCPARVIRRLTDWAGRARLSVLGASVNPAGGPAVGAGEGCAVFYVFGVLCRRATVHIYDQNGGSLPGADGVDISDLSRWLRDFGSGVYVGRSDYGPGSSGVLSIDDLSMWLGRFGSQNSSSGTLGAGFCP